MSYTCPLLIIVPGGQSGADVVDLNLDLGDLD
jgi:hypothetical protein